MPNLSDNIEPRNLWLVDPESEIGGLISPYHVNPKLESIKLNGPCTITLKNCVILEDFDRGHRGENDLLILTKTSLGSKQAVRQVHFWQEEIKQGTLIENILSGTVFATIDYPGDPLQIEFQITEVDTGQNTYTGVTQSLGTVISLLGGAFPVLAFYTPYARAIIEPFGKLLDKLERDDQILAKKTRFLLNTGNLRRGDLPLQAGDYVIFTKPVRGAAYYMSDDGTVHPRRDIPSGPKLENISYLSFSIYPEMLVGPEFIIGQQLETLLEQLRFNEGSRGETFEFLIATMTAYNDMKQLNRYLEIFKKPEAKRTPEEKALLEKIANNPNISPYLPR